MSEKKASGKPRLLINGGLRTISTLTTTQGTNTRRTVTSTLFFLPHKCDMKNKINKGYFMLCGGRRFFIRLLA